YETLHDGLKDRGFVIYAGQGRLRSGVFRVAHMGAIGDDDLGRLSSAFEDVLGSRR
ncbi:MAG: 2-aminoethylphosphonate aminotransferase, partial [Gemmatimonadota bacterium]